MVLVVETQRAKSAPTVDFKTLALTASAFSIAIAWNEALNKLVRTIYPSNPAGATIAYAIVVTIIVVIIYAAFHHVSHVAKRVGNAINNGVGKFRTFPVRAEKSALR